MQVRFHEIRTLHARVFASMAFQKIEKAAGGFFSEFWSFAAKGNIFDLAVGVVLGSAFGAVVSSLVTDIVTPFLSLATNHVNFSTWEYTLRGPIVGPGGNTIPAVAVNYGHLLQTGINFLVVALSIFLFVKLIVKIRKRLVREEEAGKTASLTTQEKLLTDIRDILKEKQNNDAQRREV